MKKKHPKWKVSTVVVLAMTVLILGVLLRSDTNGHVMERSLHIVKQSRDLTNPFSPEYTPKERKALERTAQTLNPCLNSWENGEHDNAIVCLNKELRRVAQTSGVRFALDVIEPISQKHSWITGKSHELSHTIGNFGMEYDAYADAEPPIGVAGNDASMSTFDVLLTNRLGRVLVECDGWGAFGCYHGVIETALSRISPLDRTRIVKQACMKNPFVRESQFYVNQCLHWFGHGMAIFTSQTLMETLLICEGLDTEFLSDDVQLCLSGVFHAAAAPGDVDDDFLHNIANVYQANNVYYPCSEIPERFRGHCFSHIPSRAYSADSRVIFKMCEGIPEKDGKKKEAYIRACYDAHANTLLVNTGLSAAQAVADCQEYADPRYVRYCYGGAARYWVLRDPLLNNLGPFEICSLVKEDAKPYCYGSIGFGNNENYYSQEILENYCSNAESERYQEACMQKSPL